jgi:hypothetical protein
MRLATILDPRYPMGARERLSRLREWVTVEVAWRLPHSLVMWCAVRVGAHATTGAFGSTVVPELTVGEALKRWDDPRGGDRRVR